MKKEEEHIMKEEKMMTELTEGRSLGSVNMFFEFLQINV
jgi:hypothetical protein